MAGLIPPPCGEGRPALAGRGGGLQLRDDRLHNAFQIPIDVGIPESDNAKALFCKECIALSITPDAICQTVLSAIRFDHDALTEACEVNDVSPDRSLPAEVITEWL